MERVKVTIQILEVVGHECAAMVVTEGKTACDPGRNGAKLCFDRHADSLGSDIAITNLGNVHPRSPPPWINISHAARRTPSNL